MKGIGYGRGYRYVHDDASASEEMPCLPERFRGREYLSAGSRHVEGQPDGEARPTPAGHDPT